MEVTLIGRLKLRITLDRGNIFVHIDIKIQSSTRRKAETRDADTSEAVKSTGRANGLLREKYINVLFTITIYNYLTSFSFYPPFHLGARD